MRVRVSFVGVLGVALSLALSPGAGAAVVKVNCGAGGNLQSKLTSAPAGSTILVKGTCVGSFTVAKKLTLKGNPKATLDANDAGSVLTTNSSLRLVDLTIRDGTAPSGGGIYALGGTLTLVRTTVTGNVATSLGGGIATATPVILQHSVVSGNKVETSASGPTVSGGGIAAYSVTMTDSAVRYNTAHAMGFANPTNAQGGGIVLLTKGLVATRSHIDHNTARADGPSGNATGGGIFKQSAGKLRLTGSTVSKNATIAEAPVGTATVQGGAIYGYTVIAKQTVFAGNRGSATSPGTAQATGGAVALIGSGSTFARVRILNTQITVQGGTNALGSGLGISLTQVGARLAVTDSTISGGRMTVNTTSNTAQGFGGGIQSFGTATVTRTTISGNRVEASSPTTAQSAGGGIRTTNTLTVASSTISGNTVTSVVADGSATAAGGGIASEASGAPRSTITNSTVTGNSARSTAAPAGVVPLAFAEGGGIFVSSSALRLVNATVARNRLSAQGSIAFASGGGVYSSAATLELRGTLVAGNTGVSAADCAGPMTSLGYNLIASFTGCSLTTKPSDKTNKPAKLGTFGLHGAKLRTIDLKKGSPALNAIPKASCKVKLDERGVKRPQQKKCEIGAWERRP